MTLFSRRITASLTAAAHLLLAIVSATVPLPSLAQSADVQPPSIELQVTPEGVSGDAQVFTATVTDDQTLDRVVLHYRLSGQGSAFSGVPMLPIGDTAIHSATIESTADHNLVQYYIEAIDSSGNRAVEGFAFDPLERILLTPDQIVEAANEPVESSGGLLDNRKLVYGAIGLLVLGALAASSGSSGGSSGSNGSSGPLVPVIITSEEP